LGHRGAVGGVLGGLALVLAVPTVAGAVEDLPAVDEDLPPDEDEQLQDDEDETEEVEPWLVSTEELEASLSDSLSPLESELAELRSSFELSEEESLAESQTLETEAQSMDGTGCSLPEPPSEPEWDYVPSFSPSDCPDHELELRAELLRWRFRSELLMAGSLGLFAVSWLTVKGRR
jgi:hypothetical protein